MAESRQIGDVICLVQTESIEFIIRMPKLPSPTRIAEVDHLRVFRVVENQYFALEGRWRIYSQLVGASKRDRELMRKYLGFCARVFMETLEDDLFVRVAKLIDRRPDVVSLWDLTGRLDRSSPPPKRGSLSAALQRVCQLATNVTAHRDNRIAHLNRRAVTKKTPWLPKVERKELRDLVRRLGDLIRRARAIWQPGVAVGLSQDGDGNTLLFQLRRVDRLLSLFRKTTDEKTKNDLRDVLMSG